MKKSALFILAAIFVIGIQSCTTDEQEEISPENFTTEKNILQKLGNPGLSDCFKTIFIDYGNLSPKHRDDFKRLASYQWYDDKVFIQPTHCHSVEAWIVPCDLLKTYTAKNDEEKDIVIDAEESLTIGEGGAPPPPFITSPTYIPESVFDYNSCLTGINDNTDNNNPIIIDDDDPDNNPGLPIRNIR